jgi:cutinase
MITNKLRFYASALICAIAFGLAGAAHACDGYWSLGIGGLNDNQSRVFWGLVDQPVGYNSFDVHEWSGVNEIQRLVSIHRAQCPGDHIHLVGYSGGAAALHIWTTLNSWKYGNLNVVLIADPKNPYGPGGFAALELLPTGYPVAGVDNYFNGTPVYEVCNYGWDHICDKSASWVGYLFQGAHQAYDFAGLARGW